MRIYFKRPHRCANALAHGSDDMTWQELIQQASGTEKLRGKIAERTRGSTSRKSTKKAKKVKELKPAAKEVEPVAKEPEPAAKSKGVKRHMKKGPVAQKKRKNVEKATEAKTVTKKIAEASVVQPARIQEVKGQVYVDPILLGNIGQSQVRATTHPDLRVMVLLPFFKDKPLAKHKMVSCNYVQPFQRSSKKPHRRFG